MHCAIKPADVALLQRGASTFSQLLPVHSVQVGFVSCTAFTKFSTRACCSSSLSAVLCLFPKMRSQTVATALSDTLPAPSALVIFKFCCTYFMSVTLSVNCQLGFLLHKNSGRLCTRLGITCNCLPLLSQCVHSSASRLSESLQETRHTLNCDHCMFHWAMCVGLKARNVR